MLEHENDFRKKSVIWDFIGGEPLLEIELIDKVCDYIKKQIREELKRQGHTNEWLAECFFVHTLTVKKLFLKPSIDTQQLPTISQAMSVDLFNKYPTSITPNMGTVPNMGADNTIKSL